MASVYKKTVTRKLPADAEIISRKGGQFARWRVRGKVRTAAVSAGDNGELRIRTESATYTAKYRDGSGIVREVATGCRDKTAAESVLAGLVKQSERVRGGVVSAADAQAMDHQHMPLVEVLGVYVEHLRAKGRSPKHIADCQRLSQRAFTECGFRTLRDLAGEPLERWLTSLSDLGLSPRTRNSYLQAVRGFCRWCVQSGRLPADITKRVGKTAEAVDLRRKRRSLTAAELGRLLYVTRWRPLAGFGRQTVASENPQGRATWKRSPLTMETLPAAIERAREKLADKPEKIAKLELLGRERELVYKTLVLTGLRRGELASLSVGSLVLDSPTPLLVLEAGDAKNRRLAEIPLRSDLAADLAEWVNDKREAFSGRSPAVCGVLSLAAARGAKLPNDTPLFPSVTNQLIKILNCDLAVAGIAKADERGRTVDVHALRHSFGSLLSAGGVAPRTAQAAMRHGSIDLTMNVYTDPRVLDVAGALDSPSRLATCREPERKPMERRDGNRRREGVLYKVVDSLVAPTVAPNSDKRCKSLATGDNWASCDESAEEQKNPSKQAVSRGFSERRRPDSNRGCRICNPMP